jgi:hypothetical protein
MPLQRHCVLTLWRMECSLHSSLLPVNLLALASAMLILLPLEVLVVKVARHTCTRKYARLELRTPRSRSLTMN